VLRLIKYLIIALLLFSLPILSRLYIAEPQERDFYLDWMKQQLKPVLDATGLLKVEMENITAEEIAGHIRAGSEQLQHIAACGRTKTTEITPTKGADIFQWQDELGNTHFSDQRPDNADVDDLSALYVSGKQYFNLSITEDTSHLPPFVRDQLSADVQQIYGILSKDLGLDHLRQVFINLRIIETQTDFQKYKNKVAPQVRTKTGFYSSKNNEAVVFQGNNTERMRAVIRHESSHVITAGLYGYTPVWLNEGLAEYFETLQLSGQAREIKPVAHHLKHLRNKLARGQLIPVSHYLKIAPAQWYKDDIEGHYAMAWSMVYFLMSSKEGQDFLQSILDQLAINFCSGLRGSDFFSEHYSGGMVRFEAQWRSWLTSGDPTVHRF